MGSLQLPACFYSSDEFNHRADAAFSHQPNTVRFVDDLLRFDRSFPAHVQGVCSVLQAAQDTGCMFNSKKFFFTQERVKWVGYIVQHGVIGADPDKLKAIADFCRDFRHFRGNRTSPGSAR